MATLLMQHHHPQDSEEDNDNNKNNEASIPPVVRLIDLERDEPLPNYVQEQEEFREQVYVLFPSDQSVPLSSVYQQENSSGEESTGVDTPNIHDTSQPTPSQNNNNNKPTIRLIVLDCKWTGYKRLLESTCLSTLPQVHLDHPPTQSFYWRWHSAGEGCLSSAEAVFWAAWQWPRRIANNNNNHHHRQPETEEPLAPTDEPNHDPDSTLLDLLWLFAVQRALIQKRFQSEPTPRTIPHLPFSPQAKDHARKLRAKQGEARRRQKELEKQQQQIHDEQQGPEGEQEAEEP